MQATEALATEDGEKKRRAKLILKQCYGEGEDEEDLEGQGEGEQESDVVASEDADEVESVEASD